MICGSGSGLPEPNCRSDAGPRLGDSQEVVADRIRYSVWMDDHDVRLGIRARDAAVALELMGRCGEGDGDVNASRSGPNGVDVAAGRAGPHDRARAELAHVRARNA